MVDLLHLEEMLKKIKLLEKKNSVLFTDTKCVVLYPDFKLLDESQVLLKVPRNNNMYGFNLKNIVPVGGLTCLFAKATLDESNLWHRRLGHINFKTMNKLMKGNLVRGLPSKLFENDHTCVACQKGKQHKASYKTKTAEAVYTACYVQNRVLVIKPHNKTPYELFLGRKPTLSFMKPFGYPFTILNTLDHLGTKANIDVRQAIKNTVPGLQNVLLPLLTFNSQGPKSSEDEVADDAKKKNTKVLRKKNGVQDPAKEDDKMIERRILEIKKRPLENNLIKNLKDCPGRERAQINKFESMFEQDKDANGNRMFTPVSAAGSTYVNLGGSIPNFRIFSGAYDDEVEGAEADFTNLELTTVVSPIPTTRIHRDHPKEQILRDPLLALQTRRITKTCQEHAMKVWRLVDLPKGKHAIGTKWVYRNKKDERVIVVRNKARLVAKGYTQEKGIDYDEVFAPVARIKEIGLFLAYASFMGFIVYQMDVKSAFFQDKYVADILKTASTPIETNKALLKDEEAEDVDVHLYISLIKSLMYLTASRPDIMFDFVHVLDSKLHLKLTSSCCEEDL
nr:ribonuclease H-like domain-containing protein [Tanacetum cinerariifolium]